MLMIVSLRERCSDKIFSFPHTKKQMFGTLMSVVDPTANIHLGRFLTVRHQDSKGKNLESPV